MPKTFSQIVQYSIYDFESRLSKDLIKDIETDEAGFIWTATDKGVLRYDGQRAIFYKDEIPGGFSKALLRTAKGRLLVLHDFGLTEIISGPDTILFNRLIEGKPEDADEALHYPKTIYEDRQGQIWIGENQSVATYKDGTLKKYRFTHNENFGVLTRSFAFIEDTSGKLWVMAHSGFLFVFDKTKDAFVEQPLEQKISEATCIVAVDMDIVWIGGKDGIFELELSSNPQPLPVKKIGGPANVSCALVIEGKDFIAGTWNGGLYHVSSSNAGPVFEKIGNLPFNDIVGLCLEKNNSFWVTGRENSALLKPVLFERFDLGTKNPASITSLSLAPDGNLLVIGDENEINKQEIYELENEAIKWEMDFPVNPFSNIPLAAFDDGGNIWVGDLSGDVYYLDKKIKSPIKIDEINSSNSPISTIIKDHYNNIWIGGNINYGLVKIAPDKKLIFYKYTGLLNSKIIYPTPDGSLYAGGNGAEHYLFKFNNNNGQFENISISLGQELKENFEVKDMVQDKSGHLFLATTDGVFKIDFMANGTPSIEHINLNKVPFNEPSNALAFAPDGTLWVSTTSGLVALNKTSSFLFDKSSGLPANSFTDKGLVHDSAGNLWVGTANGLSFFRHEKADFPITPAPIIEAVKVNAQKQKKEGANHPAIPYNAGIEINFLSLSFPTDHVIYKTRLMEKDTHWSEADNKKQWYVSGLQPGQYTFQVIAQQQEGMRWSGPSSFSFEIDKPWYQKMWFLLILTALSIAFISLVARLYNIQLIKQKKNLEATIKKRTDEINRQKNEIIEQHKQLLGQNEKVQKLKDEQYENELKYKNKQLTTYTLNLIQKNQTLKELRLNINQVIRSTSKSSYQEMRKLLNLIDYSFRKDEDWENFKLFFEEVHVGFFENLMKQHPKLTSHDLRHCALIRLNLTIEEMSTIIGISADSIKTARFRLKKKMDLDSHTDLLEYLMTV